MSTSAVTHPDGAAPSQAAATTPRRRRFFASFHDLLHALGATRTVSKILIANNGLAAVKGINSIRQWCFSHLDIEQAKHCIEFEAMATPEDLGVDAEFTHLAEHYVEVPGGKNLNNYANVELIVQTALQQHCDAVYPGWGHASENPALPRELLTKTGGRVVFCGPGEQAMFSLGDKIASTIIAQSFGVPCVGWSGSHVRIPPGSANPGVVPHSLHDQAFVHTLEECVEACDRIGYPVMVKASEGGGGKGIRRCLRKDDVASAFSAVQAEVTGCHIFVMQMLSNVRHLEVQLLADQYGDCIAVRTRDCSVQRRHQKIIEEGPVVGVDPKTVEEMELAAVRMAKAVGYCGLGTVEYMYDRDTCKYHFLELNPRVQVEHPVSELISGVNLPAALLLVSLGVPLHRIPEVRKYYGESDPYGTSKIDFNTRLSLPPKGHAIAVRITAEDAEEGFRPTTGTIDEISFKDSEQCWGYFSVPHGRGGIHQFADSQFGHIFAHAATREEARRSMIISLSSLRVRGEIRYSTPFVVGLLQRQEFIDSAVHTAWLDGILAGAAARPSERFVFQALAAGAVSRLVRQNAKNCEEYCKSLAAGHTPATQYLEAHRTDTFIVESKKYTIHSGMVAPTIVSLVLNGSVLQVSFRELQSSGAMQLQLGARNVVAHVEEEAIGCRVNFSDRTMMLTADADPTKLRASVSGKLVRYLVRNGEHVSAGKPYCEIEVMKMILPLISNVSGMLSLRAAPGATLQPGKLLAEIVPDDPAAVARAEADVTSTWPASLVAASARSHSAGARTGASAAASAMPSSSTNTNNTNNNNNVSSSPDDLSSENSLNNNNVSSSNNNNNNNNKEASKEAESSADSGSRARHAVRMLWTMMQGYHPSGPCGAAIPLGPRVDSLLDDLSSLGIYSVTLDSLVLPFITAALDDPASSSISGAGINTAAVRNSTSPIQKLHFVLHLLLSDFIAVEKHYDGVSRATALETLRRGHEGEPPSVSPITSASSAFRKVFDIDFCHHQKHRVEVAKRLLGVLGQDRVLLIKSLDLLKQLTSLRASHADTASLVLQARFLLRGAQGPTFEEQKVQLRSQLEQGLGSAVRTMSVSMELACALLFDGQTPNTVPAVLELILRRAYYGEANLAHYDVFKSQNDWRFVFKLSAIQYDVLSPTASSLPGGYSVFPVHKVRLADLGFGCVIMEDRDVAASLKRFADSVHLSLPQHAPAPRDKTVYGMVFARCRSDSKIGDLGELYSSYINAADGFKRLSSEVFVFYLTIVAFGAPNSPYFFTYVKKNAGAEWSPLAATPIADRQVPPALNSSSASPLAPSCSPASPSTTVFIASPDSNNNNNNDKTPAPPQQLPLPVVKNIEFAEDRMLRNVFCPTAGRLELRRMEEHYNVNICPQFGNRKIHLYVATPKLPVKGARGPSETRRLFVRCFFSPSDFRLQPWDTITDVEAGQVMSNVIAAVDLTNADSTFVLTKMNHLFVNLVEINLDISKMHDLIKKLAESFGERLTALHFSEVEVSFRVPLFKSNNDNEQPQPDQERELLGTIPCRVFATNKTGYAASVSLFIEVLNLNGHTTLHRIQSQDDIERFIATKVARQQQQQQQTRHQPLPSPNHSQHTQSSPPRPAAGKEKHFDTFAVDDHAEAAAPTPKKQCNNDEEGEGAGGGKKDPARASRGWGSASLVNLSEYDDDSTSSVAETVGAAAAVGSHFHGSNEDIAFRAKMLRRLSVSLPRGAGNKAAAAIGTDQADAGLDASASLVYGQGSRPLSASESYPPTTLAQVKRLQAQSTHTTYVHDWVSLVDIAAKRLWKQCRKARGCKSPLDEKDGVPQVPECAAWAQQLVLSSSASADDTPAMELASIDAKQTCGMVAWLVEILLPSTAAAAAASFGAKNSNDTVAAVFVANDITWENGAFSIVEDRLFAAASVYAREHMLPFIYLSSNSGARIGLATDVQSRFKAALKQVGGDASLDYLYLTQSDLDALNQLGVRVVTEKIQSNNNNNNASTETRYKIIDVIGSSKDPIGVENLQGSALLAGHMSLNYATVPTISLVSGRSVGIGAYLNRLGRRVVQVQGSPIILTGFQAINRLLGKDVYSSQDQLGGNDIMQPNGVSHWGPSNDYTAMTTVLRWLEFVAPSFRYTTQQQQRKQQQQLPAAASSFAVPHLQQFEIDSWDRDVTFVPHVATPYDPRLLLDAAADCSTLGIFDRGSFVESLARWAATVVTGRATLGGIPLGVIAVETRTVSKLDPADPADLESRSSVIKQAGQVWFPDSSRKTADALEDFSREGLPCLVVANWRGFSGGMRDMFDEVLKFGASIVDNLRTYDKPVIIYIPPFGELRGGSWVVVDPVINHNGCVQMFADPLARGGILEPAGIVNVKFKDSDVRNLWRRSREEQVKEALTKQLTEGAGGAAAAAAASSSSCESLKEQVAAQLLKVQEQELALFTDVAVNFADLHDTPGRMLAVKCISEIVPLKESRRYFYWKLRRMSAEVAIARTLMHGGVAGAQSMEAALKLVAKTTTTAVGAGSSSSSAPDASSSQSLFAQDKKAVEYLESAACRAAIMKQCEQSQMEKLLTALRALGGGAAASDDVKKIEEMIVKTFKK